MLYRRKLTLTRSKRLHAEVLTFKAKWGSVAWDTQQRVTVSLIYDQLRLMGMQLSVTVISS